MCGLPMCHGVRCAIFGLIACAASPLHAKSITLRFDEDQSRLQVTGGFAGVNENYALQGTFVFNYEGDTASFTAVDAMNRGEGLFGERSLKEMFQLESLTGTLVGENLWRFVGTDANQVPISLDARLSGDRLELTGNTRPGCCDFFELDMRALAVAAPEPTGLCLLGGGVVWLLSRRSRHRQVAW